MTLFDATPYGPETAKRAKPARKPPPETVAVHADGRWCVVAGNQPGVVHCWTGKPHQVKRRGVTIVASHVTWCGAVGVPKTFEPGQVVQGCRACVDRGAPTARAAS